MSKETRDIKMIRLDQYFSGVYKAYDRIIQLIESSEMPHQEIADQAGITIKELRRVLAGYSMVSFRTMASIARALGYRFTVEYENLADLKPHPSRMIEGGGDAVD